MYHGNHCVELCLPPKTLCVKEEIQEEKVSLIVDLTSGAFKRKTLWHLEKLDVA